MSLILSHPTGNRNVREILSALLRIDQLAEFHTTISADPDSFLLKILSDPLKKEWLRRSYNVPKAKIKTHPYLEIARNILPKVGFQSALRHETGWASVDAVYRKFDRAVASRIGSLAGNKEIKAVYAYEDGALETFGFAKRAGMACIYDLPIAYWETSRKLLWEEALRLPVWAPTLGGGIQDSNEKLERKTQEMDLADIIVCPGKFVADSIPAWAAGKHLIVSPFGSPQIIDDGLFYKSKAIHDINRPLRILFVGSMGQRKGLGDLFEAVKQFSPQEVELVVMGSLMAPLEFYKKILPDFKYEKGRPNDQVLELMRTCDVLCLPSIVEGRALVMQEAMSQGLPLIITANTGGEDLILEGQTGFLVPKASPVCIAEKIKWFLDHRSEIPGMAEKSRQHASTLTWENYGDKIANSLDHVLSYGQW